jgi:hypothetical protein
MAELMIYDPARCCSTGVCGPEVDETLVRFAADVEWLRSRGAAIRRFNLAQEAGAFAGQPLVRSALHTEGTACLPLVVRGEEILSRGCYPSRAELASWSETPAEGEGADDTEGVTPASAPRRAPGLVGLGGSSNCG